jgi:N-acetylglutamate synthase
LEINSVDLQQIEEAALRAWPALKRRQLDGWSLGFSQGYTKRANSVNPLDAGTVDVDTKIRLCEAAYADQGLPTIFRLTPFAVPDDLDSRLEGRGYRRVATTLVQVLDLSTWAPRAPASGTLRELSLDEWRETYSAFSGKPLPPTHRELVKSIRHRRLLAGLVDAGRTVACGMAVADGLHTGLFSIITDSSVRRRGYGRGLVGRMLDWAVSQGARYAYLQVQDNNPDARRLYTRLGFGDGYRYWYRVAPDVAVG